MIKAVKEAIETALCVIGAFLLMATGLTAALQATFAFISLNIWLTGLWK